MTSVGKKYRGTKEFFRVYRLLITVAEYRGIVQYPEIARILDIEPHGQHMGREVGHILGEVSEDEHDAGRPMLSAVVVGSSGIPGPGFFKLAEQLGKLQTTDKEGAHRFWQEERKAVYEEWAPR